MRAPVLGSTSCRHSFQDASRPDYLFKAAFHKRNPADGFASYAADIWRTVMGDKDIDIPSQKRMHSHYRCEKIRHDALVAFHAEVCTAMTSSCGYAAQFGAWHVAHLHELKAQADALTSKIIGAEASPY